jgi:hypothetical protein
MTLRRWSGRLRRMRAADYVTAAEVLTLAVLVELVIRVMPFSRVLDCISGETRPAADEAAIDREHRRLFDFVAVAYDVLPFPATCLRQSLVLHGLLQRRGLPSHVRFGVVKNGQALAAHAWVEGGGLIGREAAERYSELGRPGLTPRL